VPSAGRDPGTSGGADLLPVLGAYALTRLAVLAATGVVSALHLTGPRCGHAMPVPIRGVADLAMCWDTRWFVATATQWYPAALPAPGEQTTLAFFPGYPALVAAVHWLGVPAVWSAVLVSLVLGGVATLLVWRLALCVAPPDVAVRAAVLFCCFPGAVVLSWGYSEALAAALVAGCLVALHRRRWLVGGLVAAAAGATRVDVGLGLFLAAVAAAVVAWRRDGERRAVVAPVVAPLGTLGVWALLWWRTGSPRAWTLAQERGWDQHMDFGTHAVNTVGRVLTHPFRSPTSVVQLVTLVLLVCLLGCLAWFARGALRDGGEAARAVPPWVAYTAVMVLVTLASNQVGFRPRAVLLLLPAFVAAAVRLPRAATPWVAGTLVVSQVLLLVMYLGIPLIFPP
jgi:4-amino-4-deoxy-L-arabinose transferase-like glycosyltransferase